MQKLKLNKTTFSITLIVWGVGLLSFLYMEHWMAIINLFILIIIILLFHSNIFKICLDLTLITFIGMISDHLAQVLQGPNKSVYTHLILFVSFYLIIFFIFNLVIRREKMDSHYISHPFLSKILISLLSCVTIIVLYLNIFIPTTYDEMKLTKINLIIQVGYFFILVILSVLLIKNFKEENRLMYNKMQQSLHNEYVTSLEAINREMQNFRHDYLNILVTMGGYIAKREIDELEEYFNNKIVKAEHDTLVKSLVMKNVSNLEVIELKGLLLTKLLLAVEKNITVQIEIPEMINFIPIDVIDFSRILGIFIDNAIEASESASIPIINIAILRISPNSILFVIQNSFTGEIDTNQIYKNNFSTKNGNRGLGLKNVLEIVNRYSNVLLNTRVEKKMFIQEVELIGRK